MRRWQRWLLRTGGAVVLVFLTIVGVRVHDALALPDLEPWHRFVPPSEVRARDLDGKLSLEGYRNREERVFREVRENIERRGEAGRFNRYVRGSFSSAERFGVDWNRTFERVPKGGIRGGALLLHGLTDSPYSMRWLAESLRAEGFYVLALRTPGHGTVPAALLAADWQDWMAAARMGARHVKSRIGAGKPFLIVGYSCGGGLAVKYALDTLDDDALPKPDRLVLLSPMIGVDPLAGFIRLAALPGLLPPLREGALAGGGPGVQPVQVQLLSGPRRAPVARDDHGPQRSGRGRGPGEADGRAASHSHLPVGGRRHGEHGGPGDPPL